ncbi:MAG: tetratricopeptide repeat protein [Termitinemataceae bacterium]|nr:MAG: tetratricopeptide repeat protein [Termitinemataceae bacterium]
MNHLSQYAKIFFILIVLSNTSSLHAQSKRDAAYYYNSARQAMANEDWYSGVENLLESVHQNPSYVDAVFALAECYFELGEYDEALNYVRNARRLSRLNMSIANLEAGILIALGNLSEAEAVIADIQKRQPYNKEALYTAAELDIARGKSGDAVKRYNEAVRLYPDDRRLLVSLALVLGSLGDSERALKYMERAVELHADDYRVFYYHAYLDSEAGKINSAISNATRALQLRPSFLDGQILLAALRYRNAEYEAASMLADKVINEQGKNLKAWFLKGMAASRLGRTQDARSAFERAVSIDPNDEFARTAMENLIINTTNLEDPLRQRPASWHFDKAAAFRKQNMLLDAVFEYRRGLRINPYSPERLKYAEILKLQGAPQQYLGELEFLAASGNSSKTINDTIGAYTQTLKQSLYNRWKIESTELKPHWNIAVFSVANQSSLNHTDSGFIAASYLKDILVHSRYISPLDLETAQTSFAAAFRTARPRADYFLILSTLDNERDLAIKAELFVARTGAPAASFKVYAAGNDRLKFSVRNIAAQLEKNLPFRGKLLRRQADVALIDSGKIGGVEKDTVFQIVKKGKTELESQGIGLKYLDSDIVGVFTVNSVDEEVSEGKLSRSGFFDLITEGDEIILQKEKTSPAKTTTSSAADPQLRTMLRTLR